MPGTLLVIDPLGADINGKKMFSGALWDNQTKVIRVPQDNKSLSSVSGGASWADMMRINDTLLANPGTPQQPTRIVTHSRGGSMACSWFRVMGPNSSIDPATLKWYIAGCPEMKYTGSVYLFPTLDKPVYPGDGTKCGKWGGPHDSTCPYAFPSQHGGRGVGHGHPPVMPWDITWIANQFDGFADSPALYLNVPDLKNPRFLAPPWFEPGNIFCGLRQNSMHKADPHYYDGGLTGPDIALYTDPTNPTSKYMWRMKYPMPRARDERLIRFWARQKDLKYRSIWEAGWSRPVPMPLPDYASVPSWIPFRG